MKGIILIVTAYVFMGISMSSVLADEPRDVIQVNFDITVGCFFTANQLQDKSSPGNMQTHLLPPSYEFTAA